jgi:asparagine synthase (glutamine-hydrolysing)
VNGAGVKLRPDELEILEPRLEGETTFGERESAMVADHQARLLRLLWNSRRLILRASATGFLASTLIAFLIPSSYTAEVQLMPPDTESAPGLALMAGLAAKAGGGVGSMAGDLLGLKSSGALFMGVLRSQTAQDRLIQQFGLQKVYRTKLITDARKQLDQRTAIAEDRKSGIISISVNDHDPKRAAALADGYVNQLNTLVTELSTSAAHREGVFLAERLKVAQTDVSSDPSFTAIDSYLSHQYVPSPLTAFAGIFKLPPAHYLLCDSQGDLKIARYWSPPVGEKTRAGEAEISTELVRLLRDSVRGRMISDVPLGVFLSGGIDSGTVAALMAMESSRPVQTFSIGFEDESIDELSYARKMAERYGTDHHEFVVKPSTAEVLPLLVRHYGEPFADSSAIPTYYVSKLAREQITVALSGDGGDESFSGYEHYPDTDRWSPADFVPLPVRRQVSGAMQSLLESLPYGNLTSRMNRAWQMVGATLPDRYRTHLSIVKEDEKRACYTPYFRSLLEGSNGTSHLQDLPWDKSMDRFDWMARHDQNFYLPDCLMVKTDVASMANSLEVRCPFLDHKLVEFAATIPSSLKRKGRSGKAILKRAVRNLFPADVLQKPKTGFSVPLSRWLRTDLAGLLQATLLDERCARRGLFRPSFLKMMIDEQIDRKRDWSNRLWAFLFLELWFREYVD